MPCLVEWLYNRGITPGFPLDIPDFTDLDVSSNSNH